MSLPTLTGLDQLVEEGCARLQGKRIGLVCHQASVDRNYHHALDILLHHKVNVTTAFGPQHGIWGHTQDNMIEWEGYRDPRTQIPIHSLYGEVREPTDAMLQDIDLLVFDVVDVGCRVYTFIWTLAYCLRAAARNGIPVLVLDRPNPIGNTVEGPDHDPAYSSFVGLFSLPMRHGATIGEIALWLHQNHVPGGQVDVLWTKNHDPRRYHDETGLPWVIPSPNMPTPDTAIVYPGQVLLEGTNLSEGRGTTRPFEMCGAPWLDPWRFCDALNERQLPGIYFRPISYLPTFQKHAGTVCGGAALHITDRHAYQSVLSTVTLLQVAWEQSEGVMQWNDPPYEYEATKLPIDILAGGPALRDAVESKWEESDVKTWLNQTIGTMTRPNPYH